MFMSHCGRQVLLSIVAQVESTSASLQYITRSWQSSGLITAMSQPETKAEQRVRKYTGYTGVVGSYVKQDNLLE